MKLEALDIPKAKINQFNNKGIETVEELSQFFPRKYYDFRNIIPISQLEQGNIAAVYGIVQEIKVSEKVVRAKIKDSSGGYMWVLWFNRPYVNKLIFVGNYYIFCGKIQINETYHSKQMPSPLYFGEEVADYQRLFPVYSKIQAMSDSYLQKCINSAIAIVNKNDYLEPRLINKFGLIRTPQAYKQIHQPQNEQEIEEANKRFIFDDLFSFCIQITKNQEIVNKTTSYICPEIEKISQFIADLPYELTSGQKNAVRTIYQQMRNGKRVDSLIQGDVGCGKTIVAVIIMLISHINGYQSALMCPTSVLAQQHYEGICEVTKNIGCKIAYLDGKIKTKEKREILKGLEDGTIDIVIGTHAVIQKNVKFKKLALTVVDEEHRFGVEQRNLLKEKAKAGVHSVTMSATPIPRTLALTLYGDGVEVITINTLPKGRQPIKTLIYQNEIKTYESMYNQIKEGRQCYVVCPLIEDSDSELLENVDSVETTYKKMISYFRKYPEVKIGMINGRMKQEIVSKELEKFSDNETQIIISTTIIEVGVNVPNATVILIKNAERFGLSQLHQLRGRVGRGNYQSYCVLLSAKKEDERLQAMCQTTDGFKIAKIDLKLRGAGDFIGTKQSGANKYVMLMMANPELYEQIKEEVIGIYKDPIRYGRYAFFNDFDF